GGRTGARGGGAAWLGRGRAGRVQPGRRRERSGEPGGASRGAARAARRWAARRPVPSLPQRGGRADRRRSPRGREAVAGGLRRTAPGGARAGRREAPPAATRAARSLRERAAKAAP